MSGGISELHDAERRALMTSSQVAAFTGADAATVAAWIAAGTLRVIARTAHGHPRFDADEVYSGLPRTQQSA